ncbi:MAG: sigma-70 family RNA polymerase sigma factor, partial [Scytonema sp. PMC 1069.18]|nr:sigma-70 family RNA polymerase sigma factor [Scytonema sp. PMC 1069.18]
RMNRELAERTVKDFLNRFDKSYEPLLYYAALPLILTPELLHYLRHHFTPQVPFVAEVDLLLSEDICQERTFGQYTMHSNIRNYLLAEARSKIDIIQAAGLLVGYLRDLERSNAFISLNDLKAQAWSAMVYLDEYRGDAVFQITEAFRNAVENRSVSGLATSAEIEWLAKLVIEFSYDLEEYPFLVEYALIVKRIVQQVISREEIESIERLASNQLPTFTELLTAIGLEKSPQILRGLTSSDDEAWNLIYEVYAPRLRRFISRIASSEDMVQDALSLTLFQAYQRRNDFEYESEQKTFSWLMKIARNNVYNLLRRDKRGLDEVSVDSFIDQEDSDIGPKRPITRANEQYVEQRLEIEEVFEALDTAGISPRNREIYISYFLRGYSKIELAEQYFLQPNTISNIIYRITKQLRQILEVDGISVKDFKDIPVQQHTSFLSGKDPNLSATEVEKQLTLTKLLEAGWDTSPFSLRQEVRLGRQSTADYVLYFNESPIAVVEAKRLDTDIRSGIDQAKRYASILDLRPIFVTNGEEILQVDPIDNRETMLDRFPSAESLVSTVTLDSDFPSREEPRNRTYVLGEVIQTASEIESLLLQLLVQEGI